MGLRESILEYQDPALTLEEVPVPEWGQSVWVRGWTGKERDAYEDEFGDVADTPMPNLRARILVRFLLDAEGKRIFSDSDAEALGSKFCGPLVSLLKKVIDKGKATKDAAENAQKN